MSNHLFCIPGIGKSAILDEFDNDNDAERAAMRSLIAGADDNRQQPRRLAHNPRREGYERDNSYVGMTDADISRSRWVAGIDDEIHREPK